MKVIVAKSGVTLGTFPLPCVVSGLKTLKTKHMKTLSQDGVLLPCVTARTSQFCLKV